MNRKRLLYFFITIIVIVLGLLSRTHFVPEIVYPYLGDFLYALMFFFIFGFLFKKTSTVKITVLCILFCYGIETLQLYQADWINAIRSTRAGGLVLGFGFLWSDILAYTLGGLSGYYLESRFLSSFVQQ